MNLEIEFTEFEWRGLVFRRRTDEHVHIQFVCERWTVEIRREKWHAYWNHTNGESYKAHQWDTKEEALEKLLVTMQLNSVDLSDSVRKLNLMAASKAETLHGLAIDLCKVTKQILD